MSDSKMSAALVILVFHNLFWLHGEYTMMTVCGKSKVCNELIKKNETWNLALDTRWITLKRSLDLFPFTGNPIMLLVTHFYKVPCCYH